MTKNILEAAANTIQDRDKKHGDSEAVHTQIATLWSAILGRRISAKQVMIMMIIVKLVRLMKGDNGTSEHTEDIAGYAQLLENLEEDRNIST